jgi:hypothetical protein
MEEGIVKEINNGERRGIEGRGNRVNERESNMKKKISKELGREEREAECRQKRKLCVKRVRRDEENKKTRERKNEESRNTR